MTRLRTFTALAALALGTGGCLIPQKDLPPADLAPGPQADLAAPPDLTPECARQSDCPGGQACLAGRCAPCARHGDCDLSQTCDEARCLDPASLRYVDNQNGACTSGGEGSLAAPFCKIADALTIPGNPILVRVRMSSTSYGRLSATDLGGKRVVLYGGDGAGQLAPLSASGVEVLVDAGRQSDVTLDGFALRTEAGVALSCQTSTTARLRRSRVSGYSGTLDTAVKAVGCEVEIDRCSFVDNSGPLVSGARVSIVNSVLSGNKIPSSRALVTLNNARDVFRFNTLVSNTSDLNINELPVDCKVAVTLEDSILVNNARAGGSQLRGQCQLRGVVLGSGDTFSGGGASTLDPVLDGFRLTPAEANLQCCVDRASGTIDRDHLDQRRPLRGGYDIGAHELP